MNKDQVLYMNFWAPSWSPWGDGRDDRTMPWYVNYDWVEVWSYNHKTKGFDWVFDDQFNGNSLNPRWHVSNYSSISGSLNCYHPSQVWVANGHLTIRLSKDTQH